MITEQELYERLTTLETEILQRQEDIKQLKKDAAYHKDDNPNGIPKDDVSLTGKCAKLEAKRNFEEFDAANKAIAEKYKLLSGYDD